MSVHKIESTGLPLVILNSVSVLKLVNFVVVDVTDCIYKHIRQAP